MAKLLFIHQNFPGQFLHISQHMARQGHQVHALGMTPPVPWPGVHQHRYSLPAQLPAYPALPGLRELHTKMLRGQACAQAMRAMDQAGFAPDAVIAHPGWGESLYARDIWPHARQLHFLEFYYQSTGQDVDFDPEFRSASADPLQARMRIREKNINGQLALDEMDWGISPTQWQKSTYPQWAQDRTDVIFDGIDTKVLCPNPQAVFEWSPPDGSGAKLRLHHGQEVITFVNRNLEPYRGYHVFMRALPEILRRHPKAHVVLVGGDDVSYGGRPPEGQSWKQIYWQEVASELDAQRVHFVGRLPRQPLTALLQVSACHVYLTYPFVLSWSCIEAMSIGCPIAASDTAPVAEFIQDGQTGLLFDFFSPQALAHSVDRLLSDKPLAQRLGQAARAQACAHYDLQRKALPQQQALIERLLA